jgi:hypothetical protein
MKSHYDFSKAVQGKLHRSPRELRIPVYLDQDLQKKLVGTDKRAAKNLSKLVNLLLRSQLEMVDLLK